MSVTIPALTIWQPWASLILLGAKPYEFRSWAAPKRHQGRRIAIHAGARRPKPEEIRGLIVRLRSANAWTTALKPDIALPILERLHADPKAIVLSHILGTAVLGVPVRGTEIVEEFGGTINDSDRDEHGNWAWPLSDIEPLMPPEPAKGAQGFWPWHGVLAA